MDRTLFSPLMIETFKSCRKAYWLAFGTSAPERHSAVSIVKGFLFRGLGEINKGKITTQSQIQKFMGQHWPLDRLNDQPGGRDSATRAFLNTYKVLAKYLAHPYRPAGAELVSINTKIRSAVPGHKIYLEDTFDMILWHPRDKRLELVIYYLKNDRQIDPLAPDSSTLIRQYLAQRLKMRYPYEKLTLTLFRVGLTENRRYAVNLDEQVFERQFPDLVQTIELMSSMDHAKELNLESDLDRDHEHDCMYCSSIERHNRQDFKVSEAASMPHTGIAPGPVPLSA